MCRFRPGWLPVLFMIFWSQSIDAAAQSVTSGKAAVEGPTLANATIDTDELADFLGIKTWAFSFDGGSPHCWVEVTEEGQTTVSRPKILELRTSQADAAADSGKILLFLRPGDIQLRVNARVSRGGAGLNLPPTALWWGWKAYSGSATRLERPVALKEGHEITLLRYSVEEPKDVAKDPNHPRKVSLVVKAAMLAPKR